MDGRHDLGRVLEGTRAAAARIGATAGSPGSWPGFVYGVDVPRFQDSDDDGIGDLEGVRRRLDYIRDLGATWLWLLPVYLSPRRDNGYDVVDHRAVDERLGGFAAFERLVEDAHAYGLKVLTDLIVHHTSDRHPWFRAALDGDATMRHRYVWAAPPRPADHEQPMFPGEQSSVWTFRPEVGQYYRHLFYEHEPDLNAADEAVREDLLETAGFWLDLGVDGFRVDAAPHIISGGAGGKTDLGFYDDLRARVGDALLIGETDVRPRESGEYYERGRFDGLLSFAMTNRAFLAMARNDPTPLTDLLLESPAADRGITFLRNADELDLEQLNPAERAEVFAAFAPRPEMQAYGRGIRRALAPMLGDATADAIRLLFALPGLPLVMAGQEIGLGEDLSAPHREAVRLTMQWADAPLGGFSTSDSSPYVRPAQRSGPWSWSRVNVAEQAAAGDSLLAAFRSAVTERDRRILTAAV
jgi:maltose alpha-D-glucosyltransferase/alpha-amylase